MSVIDILRDYWPALIDATLVTIALSLNAWMIGLVFGFVIGVFASFNKAVRIGLRIVSFITVSVPFLVWMYWAHFPFQQILGVVIDPFITASLLLGILNAIAVAEVWQNSLGNYSQDYALVARMEGLSKWQCLRYIQVPLAFKHALPMLLALQVSILQFTLFASLISVDELFRVAQRINSSVYRPIEIYSSLGLFFLMLCGPLYLIAYKLRKSFVESYDGFGGA